MQTGSVDGGGSGGTEGLPGAAATAGQPPGQGPSSGWVSYIHEDLNAGTHSWANGRFKQIPAYSVPYKFSEESV